MNLLEELEGNGWSIQQALLSTYPFDPQFFSRYVRPRLRSRNCELPLVLVDSTRYEQNITSSDWREAPIGEDYLLEPVYSTSVFHPKVNLYASERSVYYTVSSANLGVEEYCKAAQIGQGGGFQKSWASDEEHNIGEEWFIAREIRDLYEGLRELDDYVTGQDARNYINQTATTLEWLDEVKPTTNESDRSAWFLSNLTEPILDQVVERVEDVDTVRMYAPFYGTPNVLRQIVEALDAAHVEFIVESESTAMDVGALSEALDIDFVVREMLHHTTRWVHAKFMTLEGDWGTACLYGSPNMTGTALLKPAERGNVEAGILQFSVEGRSTPLEDAFFQNTSFQFELSDPVADLSTLSLRSQSYEGWESSSDTTNAGIQLRDAQLTQPGTDANCELILRLAGLSGEHAMVVTTDDGLERRVTDTLDGVGEISVLLASGERQDWIDAVVTVSVEPEGCTSNARRVVQETQEYYREFRDITRSNGTESSTALLRSVLQNPDATAAGVFNIAISQLQNISSEATVNSSLAAPDGEGAPQFPERGPGRLIGNGNSAPSLPTLVSKHLSYQHNRASALLESDERPTPDTMRQVVDHLETFWETIELCLVMDILGELNSDAVNDNKLFNTCKRQAHSLINDLPRFVRRFNGIADRIGSDPEAKTEFLTGDASSVRDLPIWENVFDALYFHPGLLIELDYLAGRDVTDPRLHFASRIKLSFSMANPEIWQYLYDGSYIVPKASTHLEHLEVDYGDAENKLPITPQGIQALSLYLVVQDIVNNTRFLTNLQNHPRFSDESLRNLADFASNGESAIVAYDLVGELQWSFTLRSAYENLQQLRE